MARHAERWEPAKFIPLRPTPARAALILAGVLLVAGAYGLAVLVGRLRMDVVRSGSCAVASVRTDSKEHFIVQLDDGTQIGLYGYGLGLTVGDPLQVCVSKGGTWVDVRGDSSNWLLTAEPSVFPAAAGAMLAILALYAGDGIRIGRRDEE